MRLVSQTSTLWRRLVSLLVALAIVSASTVLLTGAASPPDESDQPTTSASTPSTESTSEPSDPPSTPETTPAPPPGDPAAPPANTAGPTTIQDVYKSVMLLVITWSIDVPSYSMETGFNLQHAHLQGFCSGLFVGNEGDILTAGHCVDPEGVKEALAYQLEQSASPEESDPGMPPMATPSKPAEPLELPEPDLRIQIIQDSELEGTVISKPMDVQRVAFQTPEEGDRALLKLDGIDNAPGLPLAATEPQGDNIDIRSIGFSGTLLGGAVSPNLPLTPPDNPFADPYQNDPSELAQDISDSRFRPSSKSGTISGEQFVEGVRYIETDAAVTFGMSGGPTVAFNPQAGIWEVIGINSFLTDFQPFNFISDTQGLNRFVRDHGVKTEKSPFEAAAQNQEDRQGVQNTSQEDTGIRVPLEWTLVLIIAAAVATWLATLFFRKRSSNSIQAKPQDQDRTTTTP